MAAFREGDEPWERVDWHILQLGAVSRYYRRGLVDEHARWLREHGYDVYTFDAASWTSEADALGSIERALGIDTGLRTNFDAFADNLSFDMVPEDGGLALVLLGFDAFYRTDRRTAWSLLDMIAHASWDFLLFGRRFLAMVQTDDRQLQLEPVGARTIHANWMEGTRTWRDASYWREDWNP